MNNTRSLLDRLSRLTQAGAWSRGLNPAQAAALDYLARANRFSRAPSHVADFLGTTRGTASQTLRALARKGLVQSDASAEDRRSLSYRVTAAGRERLPGAQTDAGFEGLGDADRAALDRALERLVQHLTSGARSFGICAACRHHRPGSFCGLLQLALSAEEAGQICHEYQSAAV